MPAEKFARGYVMSMYKMGVIGDRIPYWGLKY